MAPGDRAHLNRHARKMDDDVGRLRDKAAQLERELQQEKARTQKPQLLVSACSGLPATSEDDSIESGAESGEDNADDQPKVDRIPAANDQSLAVIRATTDSTITNIDAKQPGSKARRTRSNKHFRDVEYARAHPIEIWSSPLPDKATNKKLYDQLVKQKCVVREMLDKGGFVLPTDKQ